LFSVNRNKEADIDGSYVRWRWRWCQQLKMLRQS